MASHNPSRIIRTQFWIREIMSAFNFNSYLDVAKLLSIPLINESEVSGEFWELASRVTDDKELALEIHKTLISESLDVRNWGKYYNGKQARSKKKKLNDAFDKLVPKARKTFKHGKYNILSIIEASFVEEAVVLFATGLTEIHQNLNIERELRLKYSNRYELISRKLERHGFDKEFLSMVAYDDIYRAAMICLRDGRFEAAFYLLYLSMPVLSYSSELDDERMLDFHILDLAAKVIKANYFSGGFEDLANEQNNTTDVSIPRENNKPSICVRPEDEEQSFCLNYIEKHYGIDKSLWSSSYRIFEYSKDFWKPELSDRTQEYDSEFTKRRYDSLNQWR
ncbi:hypothetical protein Q4489_03785 [Thalassotalea sp. 1_MG-2023]|uniref:hypothetical protein n=1 Tax=Thalassotalea sp. 1_MG-2023 TaxID=3062680 RepID=UPI0026E41DB0|nr:hypothetical protein [Thalassotalea sp. 1_MG-2023]MDO6426116.1 hypothetical protein [Thalassotalea sp. 1_MG-2023]